MQCVYLGQPPEEQDEEAERTQSEVDRLRIIVQLLQERAERAFRAPQPAGPPQLAFGNVYTGLKPSRQSMPHLQGMEQAMLAAGQERTRYGQPVHAPQRCAEQDALRPPSRFSLTFNALETALTEHVCSSTLTLPLRTLTTPLNLRNSLDSLRNRSPAPALRRGLVVARIKAKAHCTTSKRISMSGSI